MRTLDRIEVYAVPSKQWTDNDEAIRIDDNKRLVGMDSIRIRQHNQFPDRAELVPLSGGLLTTAGSYKEITDRIKAAEDADKQTAWL